MRIPTKLEHEIFHVLLFRRDADELLLESTGDAFQLPALSIPKYTRIAERLTKSIQDQWKLNSYCLFSVCKDGSPGASIHFHVVELWNSDGDPPATMQWLPVSSLSAAKFRDANDFAAMQTSLCTLERFRHGKLPGVFGKPGWLRNVIEWIESQAALAGLALTGTFAQLNASPTFSLVRFDTDGPALWFKAVGEPNRHEFSITRELIRLVPEFVPRTIAWNADWNAWLSLEAEGTHLTDAAALSAWQRAAATLADLQIASWGNGLQFIEAGCRDIRACSLFSLVDPFFETAAELMEIQIKPAPLRLSLTELRSLADEIRCGLDELTSGEIPNTLGHLDFNPSNILASPARCVFLDWAEGSVGHPFFTFQYLLEHWRRLHRAELESERTLVSTYSSAWQAFASPDEIAKRLGLMPMLAAFAYAARLSCRDFDVVESPVVAGRLRSLTRRMKREADALRERRIACVQ